MRGVKRLLSIMALLVLSCCATANEALTTLGGGDPELMTQTDWVIRSVNGAPVTPLSNQAQPSLTFNTASREYAASLGCNRLTGGYAVALTTLTFASSVSTSKACGRRMADAERSLRDALASTSHWRVNGSVLSLIDNTGDVRMVAAAAGSDAATGPGDLVGAWRLAELDGELLAPQTLSDAPQIYFQRNSGLYSSTAGCNQLSGHYLAQASSLEMTLNPAKLNSCSSALTAREQQLIAMLVSTQRWRVEDNVLILRDELRTERAKFVRQPVSSGNYRVNRGDTFWSIARKEYGQGHCYQALANANKTVAPNPRSLREGQTIVLPSTLTGGPAGSCRRNGYEGEDLDAAVAMAAAAAVPVTTSVHRSTRSGATPPLDANSRRSASTNTARTRTVEAAPAPQVQQTQARPNPIPDPEPAPPPAPPQPEISGQLTIQGQSGFPESGVATLEVRSKADQSAILTERINVNQNTEQLPFSFELDQASIGEGEPLEIEVSLASDGDAMWVSPLNAVTASATGAELGEIALQEITPQLFASTFRCDKSLIVVGAMGDTAALRVDGRDVFMTRARDRSGARYDSIEPEGTSFQMRGATATLSLRGHRLPECQRVI